MTIKTVLLVSTGNRKLRFETRITSHNGYRWTIFGLQVSFGTDALSIRFNATDGDQKVFSRRYTETDLKGTRTYFVTP